MGQNRGSRPATIGDRAACNSGPRQTGITKKLKEGGGGSVACRCRVKLARVLL